MEIPTNGAWYKTFMWCLNICGFFISSNLIYKYKNGTNLCHLIRIIFLYTPLILLSQLIFWGLLFGTFFVLPIYLYGIVPWTKFIAGTALGAFLILIILFATFTAVKKYQLKHKPDKEREPGVLYSWIIAKKNRICPVIKWGGSPNEDYW